MVSSSMEGAERPRVGRKRSQEARRAILESALELLREQGYARLTTDAIARAAGVGKQTIYRWWRSKAAVVLEALTELGRTIAAPPSGSLERDVAAFLEHTFRLLRGPRGTGAVLRGLMAEAQLDPEFAASFAGFIAERRGALRAVLERHTGRAGPDELDVAVDMLFGAMWYRLLVGHAPLDAAFARALARLAARALARTRRAPRA
jgi:AcrR family transcriptional regulator